MESNETPIISQGQRAEEHLESAVTSAQSGAIVLRNWASVMSEFRGLYEENGFGRDLKKIMKMSVRDA